MSPHRKIKKRTIRQSVTSRIQNSTLTLMIFGIISLLAFFIIGDIEFNQFILKQHYLLILGIAFISVAFYIFLKNKQLLNNE